MIKRFLGATFAAYLALAIVGTFPDVADESALDRTEGWGGITSAVYAGATADFHPAVVDDQVIINGLNHGNGILAGKWRTIDVAHQSGHEFTPNVKLRMVCWEVDTWAEIFDDDGDETKFAENVRAAVSAKKCNWFQNGVPAELGPKMFSLSKSETRPHIDVHEVYDLHGNVAYSYMPKVE